MEETATCRRKWIIEKRSEISTVIEKYLPLKDFDMVTEHLFIYVADACILYT